MILFLVYVGVNTFIFIKTKYKTVKADIFPIMTHFVKTMEIDLMPTIFLLNCVMVFGAFYAFACILGYALIFILLPVFVVGRVKENEIVLKIAKFVNIGFGGIAFMNLFIDNAQFD